MTAGNGTGILPDEAQSALEEYLAALDAALPGPGLIRGVYLTGSAVLGDWRPGRSDLDILTVTERPLGDTGLDAVEALHQAMPDRPYRDAAYIPAGKVAVRGDTARYPQAIDGVFQRAHYQPDPVLWATLDRHGLTVRGPEARGLQAAPDPEWLREWNLSNLESYWRGRWAAFIRKEAARRDPGSVVEQWVVPWGAYGPGRLHATIATGEIISKSASADYTAKLLPEYADLLRRAKAYRLGDDSMTFTAADAALACDLVDAVADSARKIAETFKA